MIYKYRFACLSGQELKIDATIINAGYVEIISSFLILFEPEHEPYQVIDDSEVMILDNGEHVTWHTLVDAYTEQKERNARLQH